MSTDTINASAYDAGPETTPDIDPEEYAEMEAAAAKAKAKAKASKVDNLSVYTYKFREPFIYVDKEYTELTFDWGSMTGKDALDIEEELAARGITVVAPEFSSAYQITMAAKACTAKGFGSDAFELMSLAAFNQIKRAARTFLLVSG